MDLEIYRLVRLGSIDFSFALQICDQQFKKSDQLLHLNGDENPPTARDLSEVTRTLNRRFCPYTVNGGLSWCISSSVSIQDEVTDVAQSTNVTYLFHSLGVKMEAKGVLQVSLFPTNITSTPVNSTPRHLAWMLEYRGHATVKLSGIQVSEVRDSSLMLWETLSLNEVKSEK